ncbi:MAG TPA: histidine kinase [Actinomycetota bacterium]|nr:histidine kinase [Actinomycetota bacterium]
MTLSDRALRRLRWIAALVIALGFTVSFTLELLSRPDEAVFSVLLLTFPLVGFVVISRRPRATLGWLMVGVGLAFAWPFTPYGVYAMQPGREHLPYAEVALALGGPDWLPFIGISGYLLLLFPDGHLPSPRWRWFAWGCGIALASLVPLIWVAPGDFADAGFPEVQNPLAFEALTPLEPVFIVLLFAVPALIAGGAIALIVRLRRTRDDVVRHQIRWLTYVAALIAVIFALAFVPTLNEDATWTGWVQNLSALSFMLIPVAIGIAVLRYRLYDIDVVIRKTVVAAVLAAFVVLVYVGIVVGIGTVVGRRDESSSFLTIAAAGVVALVFQPLRTRARRLADRIVYGRRATPYQVLGTFGDQLAGTYSSDDVVPRIARVLAEGVGAERARVWLRVGDDLRVVGRWPADATDDGSDDLTTEVRHQGEDLGALSVSMPGNDPMNETKEELVRHLAGQAGLVLSNVRLTEELRARLDDLRAAQKRLVTAQDAERKRLERNIHDGAQQQLVALAVKLKLADSLVDRDTAKAHDALSQLQADTTRTLEDLRDLARGIYPPLLADEGLAAALSAQARRAAIPVGVDVALDRRYPPEVEAAVYFSCLEALQNVAKYADASMAAVLVRDDAEELVFEVSDDGRGFDPSVNGRGTGLQGIADRLGALDGTLEVRSAPGEGTVVTGRIAVAAAARPPVTTGVAAG